MTVFGRLFEKFEKLRLWRGDPPQAEPPAVVEIEEPETEDEYEDLEERIDDNADDYWGLFR